MDLLFTCLHVLYKSEGQNTNTMMSVNMFSDMLLFDFFLVHKIILYSCEIMFSFMKSNVLCKTFF